MSRGFRTFAAAMALVAFFASMAEELWAASCMDPGSMAKMADMRDVPAPMDMSMGMEPMPDMASMGSAHAESAPPQPDLSRARLRVPATCPVWAVSGSCMATSLPSEIPPASVLATSPLETRYALATMRSVLFVSPLPDPPKA